MSAVSFVASPTASSAGTEKSKATLANNFDTFLHILTAQIQNQDPLEPLDSSQFTEQLVQFSGVEQQIKVNQQLETLISATHSNAGASLSGYLGQQVEIDSAGAAWDGQPIHWRYNLPAESASTTVTVTDAAGHVVYSKTGELGKGDHDFEWDGSLNDGTTAKSGTPYWISVVAEDADHKAITPTHSLVTTVSGVDLTYGEPALTTPVGVFAYADIMRLIKN